MIMDDFVELSGDRLYRDDKAMVCGISAVKIPEKIWKGILAVLIPKDTVKQ